MNIRPEIPGTPADNSEHNVSSAEKSSGASGITWPDLHEYPGSYYHKEVTPIENLSEIGAVVKLGDPVFDPKRPARVKKSPDDFSIYLGVTQGRHTVDAGLSWEITLDKNGKKDSVHRAWRPFWRVSDDSKNWHSAPPKSAFYWHTGDVVHMNLRVTQANKLELTVSDLQQSGTKTPTRAFTVEFDAPGIQPGQPLSLRRITSIDQSGTEGKNVHPTRAKLVGTVWESTVVKQKGANALDLPMSGANETAIDTPAGHIRVRTLPVGTNPGGEAVDVYGQIPKDKP